MSPAQPNFAAEYNRLLGTLDLDRVTPIRIHAERPTSLLRAGGYRARLEVEDPSIRSCSSTKAKPLGLAVDHLVRFTAIERDDDASKIVIEICVLAEYSGTEPATQDFVQEFVSRNVPLHTWPFIRVFLTDVLTKMDLPKLWLPMKIVGPRPKRGTGKRRSDVQKSGMRGKGAKTKVRGTKPARKRPR